MPSAYIDVFTYQRAVTGHEKASLIGNTGRMSSSVALGATSLPIAPNTTVALQQFDQVTIFDGPITETAMVSSSTPIASTSIPLLQPTQFAHAQYTPYCTDGLLGSLADCIIEASNWVENICYQSLFQQAYTGEVLQMPGSRASFDKNGVLVFRPRHFPIAIENGITIETNVTNPITYDASQVIIDGTNQIISVPWVSPTGGGNSQNSIYQNWSMYNRTSNLYLIISYTSGYTLPNLPGDIRDSVVLFTSDIIGRRQNPTGGNVIRLGDKQINATTSRDTVGESLLVKLAKQKLQPYSVEAL